MTKLTTPAAHMTTADRMKLLEKLNKLAGYTAPKTIFPEGTPLIAVGEQNLARERERLAALPTLSDFSAAFLASQRAADHRDVSLRLADLTMAPTGHLRRRIGNGQLGPAVAVTPTALQQLVGLHRDVLELPTGFASTLQWALAGSPADRADAAQLFNQLARRAAALGGDTLTTNRVGRTAIDASTGQRYLYSFTSEKHVGIAGGYAAMVQALHAELDGVDARVSVVHQGHDRLDVSVVFPMVNREIRVGDVLWGELTLTLSEAKDVAASVRDGLMRVLCVNLTRAAYGREEQWTRKHVGGATFVRDLLGRVRGGYERLKPFVAAFGDSYADPLPRTRAEVVERTLRANTDLTRLLPAATILQAWDMDGGRSAGDTRGGLVNALTRASKALGVADAEVVEAFAGRVVTQGWASIGL